MAEQNDTGIGDAASPADAVATLSVADDRDPMIAAYESPEDEGVHDDAPEVDPGDEAPAAAADDGTPAEQESGTPTPEPDKANPGKKIEQLNYELTNQQKANADMAARLEQLEAKLEAKATDPDPQATTPTEGEQSAATDAGDDLDLDLDALELTDDDYDFVSHKEAKTIVGALKRVTDQNRALAARVAEAESRWTEVGATLTQQQQQAQTDAYWQNFDTEHPTLSGQGPQLWQQAVEDASALDLEGEALKGAALANFRRVVATNATKTAKPTRPAPPSKRPNQSTVGTRTSDRQPPAPGASDTDDDVETWTNDRFTE